MRNQSWKVMQYMMEVIIRWMTDVNEKAHAASLLSYLFCQGVY